MIIISFQVSMYTLVATILLLASNCASCLEVTPRIIGGTEVKNRSEFAFQALLLYNKAPYCGGTVIDEKHVLTAAHCCMPWLPDSNRVVKPSEVSVVVGNLNINDRSVVKNVVGVFLHENFNTETIVNDIAVWRISGSFGNTSANIRSINLRTDYVTSGYCNVSGWGAVYNSSKTMTTKLQFVEVPLVSRTICERSYPVGVNAICAGAAGRDSCQGDSGGPLVCSGLLTGIVSYGYDCGQEGYPGVYTEVAKYIKWIEEQKTKPPNATNILSISRSALVSVLVVIIICW